MNGIEMMVKTMIEKAMTNLPPEVLSTIGQVGQIAVSIKAQLDRIEAQNRLIISHLKIPDDTAQHGENDDERLSG